MDEERKIPKSFEQWAADNFRSIHSRTARQAYLDDAGKAQPPTQAEQLAVAPDLVAELMRIAVVKGVGCDVAERSVRDCGITVRSAFVTARAAFGGGDSAKIERAVGDLLAAEVDASRAGVMASATSSGAYSARRAAIEAAQNQIEKQQQCVDACGHSGCGCQRQEQT